MLIFNILQVVSPVATIVVMFVSIVILKVFKEGIMIFTIIRMGFMELLQSMSISWVFTIIVVLLTKVVSIS